MADEKYICANCGEMTNELFIKKEGNNNWLIVICLIVFGILLIPIGIGIILLIVALFVPIGSKNTKINCCAFCKSENMLVPTNTPRGKKLIKEYYNQSEDNI